MKAICISQPGGPDVLHLKEREIPQPGPQDVLIQVAAAGVNRPDVSQRKGNYPAPPDAPADIPGLEVSGTIVAVGNNVKLWEVGDQVCALLAGGGYAEFVIAPEEQCLIIPEGVSLQEAASLPETFFTVWNNVFDIGKFSKGERVLVHGGSSGIGTSAIQMVKALGGTVFVTAGSEEKCSFCRKLGADLAINYRKDDFEKVLTQYTDGKGVDIVLDMVGAAYTESNINLLAHGGRLIIINAMKGRMGSVDLIQVMKKRLTLTGSTLRPQTPAYKGQIARALMSKVWPFFPDEIKPCIYQTFPLAEAAAAHELMERSDHMGKILLEIQSTI
ncbi:MAG: NAD(P)H-quinone oxidoreductase [Lunatimonas sp.]|uniref:NAD(P)H-quinone oxidoreductase n=1 Tax=Lunatimonas sp. TaxID=2060141 RepID=UPI00263AF53B|nr:NAD(P)H-quinone oxidoreductase [Lunatimonas sp.]MCC5936566.1 NAD(P)H-quinone oxidoreductase [Lunatimonas sp.]